LFSNKITIKRIWYSIKSNYVPMFHEFSIWSL
jgi:hypothetical protein